MTRPRSGNPWGKPRASERSAAHRSSAAEDEPADMYDNRMISVLSGGRKRRPRYHLLASLWLATAALAGFVVAALVLGRI